MTPTRYQLLAVGHTPVDIVSTVDEAFLEINSLTKGRQHNLTREAATTLRQQLTDAEQHAGGAAANVACCFGVLGGQAAFDGKCADDELGCFFYNAFEGIGVTPIRDLIADPRGSDYICVLITPDRERSFASYYGINADITTQELDHEAITDSAITFLEGFQLTSEGGVDYLLAAADIAKGAGRQIAFAPSDINIIDRYKQACNALVEKADILIANIEEARALLGMDNQDSNADVLAAMRDNSYAGGLTFGPDGATVYAGGQVYSQPAAKISAEDIVNTNGAGDHFAGALLYGLVHELPLAECARLGIDMATRSLRRTSARPDPGDAAVLHSRG
jgi:sugar/nucleoside kinase (ribokinase family)